MKAGVVVFPGSNCDRDLAVAFRAAGFSVEMIWHKEVELSAGIDVIGVPGGFSWGDYLRAGAIAARAPVMRAVADHAVRGGLILGVCNGFQVLCEAELLPGTLLRNARQRYICRTVPLAVGARTPFTEGYAPGETIRLPIAHHDGNYVADAATLDRLRGEERIALTYLENPNGSLNDIAGVVSENRRVMGMMPHPERAIDALQGGTDGIALFRGLASAFSRA